VTTRTLPLDDGGLVTLHEGWLGEVEASELFVTLRDTIAWRQEKVRFFGREHAQPRLIAAYADPGAHYTYSGLHLAPAPWPDAVARVRERVVDAVGAPFNSVLLNHYRDGHDSMGLHADAERELGRDPVVAALSLGAPRRFVLRHAKRRDAARLDLELTPGSLLVMTGTTQHHYRHGIPKEPRRAGARISLTFRRVIALAPGEPREEQPRRREDAENADLDHNRNY
jgi:alkylated DNA repair dioxygenase AlkB